MSGTHVTLTKREKLEQAIAALEAQRALLGEEVVITAISSLRLELQELEARPEPQRKLATVLFADLVGMDASTQEMDTKEVLEMVAPLWERLDQVILTHGGTIDKHLSNGVMALFGLPLAQENDPERAVLAGLAMQTEVQAWREERTAIQLTNTFANLQMRIGINTDMVVFGSVGSKGEMTAMGDTVNIASRLQTAAQAGTVLVTQKTWQQILGRFEGSGLFITAKGMQEPLPVYTVQGEKSMALRTSGRGMAGIQTRMIGRDFELTQLQTTFAAVAEERRANVVTVLGDAGIGKSRLLQEYADWLKEHTNTNTITVIQGNSATRHDSYYLIRECVASWLQISYSTPSQMAREQLVAGMSMIDGGDQGMAEFIGHLIGLDFSGSQRIQNLPDDAKQIRSMAFQYLARFFAAICLERPLVLVLEDIHWADSSSLDVIEHLGQTCATLPLLIICSARPLLFKARPRWAEDSDVSTILPVGPLSLQQSDMLVEEILGKGEHIPQELLSTITEAASGNAFYIEELIKSLFDDGVILANSDGWRMGATGLTGFQVPPTLTSVLQARLDKLTVYERIFCSEPRW